MNQRASGKNQRKWRNLLISPKAQIGFIINMVVLTLFFGLAAVFVVYFQLDDIYDKFLQFGLIDEAATKMVTDNWNIAVSWLAMLIILYLVAMILIILIQSHRMIGPGEALKRQIKRLLAGDYKGRVTLREGDYYQNVADLLNQLSEEFEKISNK